jgi:hypothetical protein
MPVCCACCKLRNSHAVNRLLPRPFHEHPLEGMGAPFWRYARERSAKQPAIERMDDRNIMSEATKIETITILLTPLTESANRGQT